MRITASAVLGAALLAATVQLGFAKCGDEPGDAAAVQNARTQVASQCDCANAPDHGTYVRCAADIASTDAGLDPMDPNFLPSNCKGKVKKCAAKSTCGKLGFVTCCVTKNGAPVCKTKKDAEHCTAKSGTVGSCRSCCDSCGCAQCFEPCLVPGSACSSGSSCCSGICASGLEPGFCQ